MSAFATWKYCGEPSEGQKAALVQFSNGKLQNSENVNFSLYKSKDTANPRKKFRRILAAETDRLSYVGNNFGVGALKCNNLCRYFVGVLSKDSDQMEIYDAELFNMQPVFSDDLKDSETLGNQNKSYRDQVDFCIEAFGTTKQKRALSSRRMNKVGSETLNIAVAKAAENIIDEKGVTALVNDASQDDLQDESAYLPPCHADGGKPEEIYKFEDLLSPAEFKALEVPSAVLKNVTSEEIVKMMEENSYCPFVIEALKNLPLDEESRDRKARCLWFLNILIKFRSQTVIRKKNEEISSTKAIWQLLDNLPSLSFLETYILYVLGLFSQLISRHLLCTRNVPDSLGPDVPHIINNKLLKNFTSLTYNNGSLRNLISESMKAKITAYVIALALHINDFQTDLTMLQRDMKLSEKRIIEIAKAMRLKISKKKLSLESGGEEDHKVGTLSIPLPALPRQKRT